MDAGIRQKRVEGLEAIKNKALVMAREGKDSLEVRDFLNNAKAALAYELPDEDAHRKAAKVTLDFKRKKEKN